ncbi:hypothetical protein BJV77DRAFT_1010745, partial [Russula vinacea]
MHPHWHSASLDAQHRLISLYILSLASTGRNDATSPTSPTAPATFEYELHYTCSPYDVAAVLRWGLRHLKLDGDSFGKESGDWTWYNMFAEAERTSSYPSDAFSKFLIPQLPAAHAELLLATLDIISSLSARSEANGSSGSKLSKIFGLWLLTCEDSTEGNDWSAFYDRWDRAGRILEHLFLARIRNDARTLPRRLTDLDDLLPRPRFSTRQYDALFVRALKPKSHPLRLIADALRAQSTGESATPEDDGLWDEIKKASCVFHTAEGSSNAEPVPIFSNVFSDETIRLLSLIPVDVSDKDKSAPAFVLQSPISPGRPRSFSLPETPLSPVQTDHGLPSLTANNSTAPTTALETPTDWLQFSSHGFGTIPGTRDLVATLWDNDVEVTVPPPAPLSRKSSRRAHSQHSRHSRHSSLDTPRTPTTLIAKVKLDEAFIDFWADSLLDPISRRWPRFVLCQLKPLPPAVTSATPAPAWLVIEQRFVQAEVTSSRLSAAFSIASKRFAPKERTAPLPQGTGDAKGSVDQGVVPAVTTVGATALAVVAASQEITQKPRDDGLPAIAETTPSELASVSVPKEADEPNDLAHNTNRDEEVKSETVPAQGSAGADPLVSLPVTGELVETKTEPLVDAGTAPLEPTSIPAIPYFAGITEAAPLVGKAASAEEIITTPAEPKSANAPAGEPTPAPVQAPVLVPAAAAIEEPVLDLSGDGEVAVEPVVGSAEDLSVEPTSAAAPVPFSKQTAQEDDISMMREAQVATSADSEPIIIEDSSAMDPEPAPTDAALAIQTSLVREGQSPDIINAVETTATLEEPAEVVGGSVIKEDARPSAILERDNVISEVEATASEPATEPPQVASNTGFPVLGDADSAAADQASPEASAPNDEPDVGHVVIVTQSVEESLPLHVTPQTQDAVIEEQLTAEETHPTPDASTSVSIPAGIPTTSNDDETDAAPAESAVAENIPVVEPTTSRPTKLAPEPLTTISHDAAHSPASGSAEPPAARAEQASVEATSVLTDGNESTASPIDEDVAAESQVTTDDSESVLPYEEPSAPAPETTLAVVEDLETLAPVVEEPAANEATAPDIAEIPVEAPAPAPAESALVSEEAAPATADASVANAAPAIEEPTPLLEEVVSVTADEPAPTTEAAMPAAEIPAPAPDLTHEHSVPDTIEILVPDEDGLVVEEDGPVIEEDILVVEEDGRIVEEDDPIQEDGPVLEEDSLVVEEDGPAVEDGPIREEDGPVFEEDGPVLEEDGPVLEEDDPVLEEDGLVLEEDNLVVEEDGPIVKEDDPVAEEDEPAAPEPPVENSVTLPEDPAPATESAAPTADEIPVGRHDEERLPTLESAAAEPVVEESLPSEEQVAQEPAAQSSCEAAAIAAQEEPPSVPGVDTIAASEPEASLVEVDAASSEITGAADAPSW